MFAVCLRPTRKHALSLSKPHAGTTNGLRHGTQFGVPMRKELVTVCVGMRGDAWRRSSACHVVAKILKCSNNYSKVSRLDCEVRMRGIQFGCQAFREPFGQKN